MNAAAVTAVIHSGRIMGAPMRRWRVEGRTWAGDRYEIGFFFGRTSTEAIRECRRRKGELVAGLRLEAEARL